MDDTDPAGDGPFGAELEPAVRRVATGTDADTEGSHEERVPDIESLVGPQQTLEPGIQAVWILQGGISAAVLGVIAAVAFAFFSPGAPWLGGVVFTVVFLLAAALSVLRYRSWTYEVREDSLYLERGVVTRVKTVVPYVRIQHVDASRGPIERTFGLATTVVYTAGSRGADVSIPGLTPERADDLQNRLKQLAIAAEGEDAV
jgi:membrane protein YdbS with pleckstrin-like domain